MMMKAFIPEMKRRRETLSSLTFPAASRANTSKEYILLILDSHSSRFSSTIIRQCIQKKIILLTIPSHTSTKLQPLDLGPNGLFKHVLFNLFVESLNKQPDLAEELGSVVFPHVLSPKRQQSFQKQSTNPSPSTTEKSSSNSSLTTNKLENVRWLTLKSNLNAEMIARSRARAFYHPSHTHFSLTLTQTSSIPSTPAAHSSFPPLSTVQSNNNVYQR